jgi:hypothetical protein
MQFLHTPCYLHFFQQTSLIPWFIIGEDGMYCTGHLPFIWQASYNLPFFRFLASLVISYYRLKSTMPLYFSDVLLYIYLFDILTLFSIFISLSRDPLSSITSPLSITHLFLFTQLTEPIALLISPRFN